MDSEKKQCGGECKHQNNDDESRCVNKKSLAKSKADKKAIQKDNKIVLKG